jgi:hypothetical protein
LQSVTEKRLNLLVKPWEKALEEHDFMGVDYEEERGRLWRRARKRVDKIFHMISIRFNLVEPNDWKVEAKDIYWPSDFLGIGRLSDS